jgi:pimeloyl-ACP methyl ester carboxylesterase
MQGPPLSSSEPIESEINVQKTTGVPAGRKAGYVIAFVCLLAVITIASTYAFRMIRAVQVFAFLQNKPRPLRIYDRFFGYRRVFTDDRIPGSTGPIDVRIFTPQGKADVKPILMVHGLVPYGNRDGYLDAVADNLAGMGYMVVLPNVPAETDYEMRTSDLMVIGDTIRWAAQKTGQKVSVIGVSFGGGLAIPAALAPSVAADVKLIFSLSSYYNLDSIARYYLHDPVYDPGGHQYPGDPPGPLLILSPYLSELVPPNQFDALENELQVLKHNQGRHLTDRDPTVRRLTTAEQHKLNELETVDTPEIHQRYMDILVRHHDDFAALSPSNALKHLNVPLYVLHGDKDAVFPEGEVEWMRKDLADNKNAHILVTPWIGHALIGQPSTLVQKLAVANFGADLLVAMSRSAPVSKSTADERKPVASK